MVTSTGLPSRRYFARSGIERHAVHLHLAAIDARFGAPQNGLDARRQFARVEGLGEIIVGPELQTDNTVHVFAARGQHQHWHAAGEAKPLQDFKTVQAGQHHVQNDQVITALLGGFERRVTLMNAIYRETLALQEFLEQGAQLSVVIDD